MDARRPAPRRQRLHGQYGIFDLYPLVRLLKTAPLNREMILNYIGEHVMGLPRSY